MTPQLQSVISSISLEEEKALVSYQKELAEAQAEIERLKQNGCYTKDETGHSRPYRFGQGGGGVVINWISVKDRLPIINGVYLTKYRGDKRQKLNELMFIRTYPYSESFHYVWVCKKSTYHSITHWAEINLPEQEPKQ